MSVVNDALTLLSTFLGDSDVNDSLTEVSLITGVRDVRTTFPDVLLSMVVCFASGAIELVNGVRLSDSAFVVIPETVDHRGVTAAPVPLFAWVWNAVPVDVPLVVGIWKVVRVCVVEKVLFDIPLLFAPDIELTLVVGVHVTLSGSPSAPCARADGEVSTDN